MRTKPSKATSTTARCGTVLCTHNKGATQQGTGCVVHMAQGTYADLEAGRSGETCCGKTK